MKEGVKNGQWTDGMKYEVTHLKKIWKKWKVSEQLK